MNQKEESYGQDIKDDDNVRPLFKLDADVQNVDIAEDITSGLDKLKPYLITYSFKDEKASVTLQFPAKF